MKPVKNELEIAIGDIFQVIDDPSVHPMSKGASVRITRFSKDGTIVYYKYLSDGSQEHDKRLIWFLSKTVRHKPIQKEEV